MKIYFFNHFHNGDLLATKEFVRELMNQLPADYYYLHNRHPKVIGDLDCKFGSIPSKLPMNAKFAKSEDGILINTWVGAYIDHLADTKNLPFNIPAPSIDSEKEGINWICYHKIWTYIFDVLNKILDENLALQNEPKYYAHTIDYSKFKTKQVDEFLQKIDGKDRILISNGFVHSKQSHVNDLMESQIDKFTKAYPDKVFICTAKLPIQRDNLYYTDDIIENDGCDLNEIAYLSERCRVIIGRNSGPFLFAHTKSNLSDPTKKFLALGNRYGDCFNARIEYPCEFKYVEDLNQDVINRAFDEAIA